jgi:diketogulonate reductase-like aldo/keto reductase
MSEITFTLNSGAKVPALAWGCGSGKAKTSALESGKIALDAGFKHIDTAQLYYTEEAVGEIVAAHSLSKDDVFITSKRSCFSCVHH